MMLDDTTPSVPTTTASNTATTAKNTEDIMSVLLQHEKRGASQSQSNLAAASLKQNDESSDSSGEEPDQMGIPDFYNPYPGNIFVLFFLLMFELLLMLKMITDNTNADGDDDDEEVPMISVGSRRIPLTDIDDTVVRQMTQEEKDRYIQVYQEYYSDMFE